MRWRISEGVRHRKLAISSIEALLSSPPDVLIFPGTPGRAGVKVGFFKSINVVHGAPIAFPRILDRHRCPEDTMSLRAVDNLGLEQRFR
jgi:hypothetical protein